MGEAGTHDLGRLPEAGRDGPAAGSTPAAPRRPERFDPAATAAAGALALVAGTEAVHPFGVEQWHIWIDVVADEWLVWFSILYAALLVGQGVAAKLAGGPPGGGPPPPRPRVAAALAAAAPVKAGESVPPAEPAEGNRWRHVGRRDPSTDSANAAG
jgi:hypothetical protein